ncbi:MAG: LacI family DNA-binding transcriptional regulator [Lachnospiraceae bacterium]|nr:LacI family DNA-binding transcriptional regulator [Lachnospiraceae bacterium]
MHTKSNPQKENSNNSKKPSIIDVAKLAGVSPGTVSNALNSSGYVKSSTKEKVLHAIKELNYIPNRAGRILKTNKTNLIMLAVPDTSNEIYFRMIESVQEYMKPKGYSILLYYTNGTLQEELRTLFLLRERVIDGLILVHFSYNEELFQAIESSNSPVVLISMCNHLWAGKGNPFDTISVDVHRGIYESTKHLINMGHSKIGYLAGKKGLTVYEQRYSGYCQALNDAGIKYRNDYVMWNDYTILAGNNSSRSLLLLQDKPTAICASNDHQALGSWQALQDMNIAVPGEIALVGMDNIISSKIIGLTSFDMHEDIMGNEAAKLLYSHLEENSNTFKDIYLVPSIRLRNSSIKLK